MIKTEARLLEVLDKNLTFSRIEFIMKIPLDVETESLPRLINLYDRAIMYRYEYVPATFWQRVRKVIGFLI
jgi:hypothetical protein